MKGATRMLLALIAIGAGALTGGFLVRFPATHRFAGRIFQRGDLIALVEHRGIFAADLRALQNEKQYRAENEGGSLDDAEKIALRDELIAGEELRNDAVKLRADDSELDRGLTALRHQFADDQQFHAALHRSGIFERTLKHTLAETICGEQWIENRIGPQVVVPREQAQKYFEQHQAEFIQPLRIRARHIFLAAPEGSSPQLMEAKRRAMQEIVTCLSHGEDFAQLAAAVSEDEATRTRGSDLGFFAANRMPAEFFAAVEKVAANAPPQFLQSHLGFHAVQVTDSRPARMLTFEEALPEIIAFLEGEKRREAVPSLQAELWQHARFVSE